MSASLFGTAAAAHASPTPTPDITATANPAAPELSPVLGTDGVVRRGDALRAAIAITAPADAAVPAGVVTVSLAATPLPDTTTVDSWLGGVSSPTITALGSTASPAVAAGEQGWASASFPATDPRVSALAPGTYAAEVIHTAGAARTVVRTVVTIAAADASAQVVTVVPIIAPVADRTLLTADDLEAMTAPDGVLTARLDAVLSADVVLAVDPSIPAAIRALGTAAPSAATEWLTRLDGMPNPRFALPFADADLATQADAGLLAPLQPGSLGAFMRDADFPQTTPTPTPSPDPTPTATATPDAAQPSVVLPTLDELTDVHATLERVSWPRTGTVTEDLWEMLAGDTLLVANSQLSAARAAAARVDSATVFGYDDAASAALAEAGAALTDGERAIARARVAAFTSFATAAAAGAPVLLIVDRSTSPLIATSLREALGAVRTAAGQPAPWSALTAATPAPADLIPAPSTGLPGATLNALLQEQDRVGALATVLTDPTLLTGRERARLLQLLGASGIASTDWATRAAGFRATTAEILNAVRIVPRESVNIVSRGVNIPVWITNDLAFPVNVDVIATPGDVRLEVPEVTPATVDPQSSTRVLIPVTAGISNGDVLLRLALRSPAGVPIGEEQHTQVTVRADWEQIGLVVLASIVALLLIFGTWRTIRRRRRSGEVRLSRAEIKAQARAEFRGEDTTSDAPADTNTTEGGPRG